MEDVHQLNVFQKLIKVKEAADGFFRDASSPGLRYKYVSGSQILDKITDCMNTIGLVLVPKSAVHREWKQYDYMNAKGEPKTDFIVMGDLTYCLVNADKPSDVWEIPWQYYGQQDEISKAFGSGLTYSERYILLKVLGLPTDEDDPDGQHPKEGRPVGGNSFNKKTTEEPTKYNMLKSVCDAKGVSFDRVLKKIAAKFNDKRVNDLTKEEWESVYLPMQEMPSAEVPVQ